MPNKNSLVSIGLPVYNAGNFIDQTLKSILEQPYREIEVIISDNASSDNTEEICRGYAARDRRIRYYRNKENLGVASNHNRVFELSLGDYFMWAAHDDVRSLDYIQRCVEVLEKDLLKVLCFSGVGYINELGQILTRKEVILQV